MKQFLLIFGTIFLISLALTGLLFLLRKIFGEPQKSEEHINPSIFTFFTSLYAFFLGFAIVTLWSAFLTAKTNVTREADSLMISYRLSRDLPNSQGFQKALADYVKIVVEDEWPRMEEDVMSGPAQRQFEKVWEQLRLLRPQSSGDIDRYLNLSNHLSEASKQRFSRELLVGGNLYPPIWVIIVFGFISVCYGLYFFHIQQNLVRLIFDFMAVFVVLACIFFIYDISTPFSGYIVVKPEIFKAVYASMQQLP
ncbi:MAG: hypothetical protein AB1424_12120 [Thermodesulfobacteriota bacterium]